MAASAMQLLAEKTIGAKGPDYWTSYHTLRMYIKGLSDTAFAAEIERVDNPDVFRLIWSCGLSYARQATVTEAWRELESRLH